MASASSSAARLLIRDGKTAASLLLRGRTANLTETVQNTRPAIRSLLWFNQTPVTQYPVNPGTFPMMQSGFRVEAGHGKRVVDKAGSDSEEEIDFDEEEFDDIDVDDEFDEIDEDDDDDDEEEDDDDDKYTRKEEKSIKLVRPNS